MKKKLFSLLLIFVIILTTGCIKRDKMEDIEIITTIYPIKYVTERLYGNSSSVLSIYPNGVDTEKYTFTNKQLKDYSEYDLFIYNGKSNEREYATTMLNINKDLKIIDASYGLDKIYSDSDIWLNPANILMIAQNIKDELDDYISNPYIKKEIEEQYELIKIDISELDTELKRTADNCNNKKIISADETLLFLEKYGFEVINLTESNNRKENNIELAKALLNNNSLSYIFVNEYSKELDVVKEIINNTSSKLLTFKSLETISDEDLNANEDYISIMNSNIASLKEETYK